MALELGGKSPNLIFAGADLQDAVEDSFDWTSKPFTYGACASAESGFARARKQLNKPLDESIWFAGEALCPDD